VKRLAFIFLAIGAALACTALFLPSNPPKESKVIESFHTHRAAFERLRDMLVSEKQRIAVARWGVETANAPVPHVPPDGGFPVARYQEYLALLKEVGGTGAFRGDGEYPENISIGVWAHGWAGDTRHVEISWQEHEPPNQVPSIEDFYQTPKPRKPVFRHIEGNWYVWADR
jgi:hypothetical protein